MEQPDLSSVAISKPLLKLKLLDALRQGSFPNLQDLLKKQFQPLDDPNVQQVLHLMLHYAVQVAPMAVIKEIVHHWVSTTNTTFLNIHLDLNERDSNGNTPLHIAAYQSRGDIVAFLLDQPTINDCVLNNSHLQAIEMCKNLNIAQMMQVKRSTYVAETAQEFRTAFNNRDFGHLESILSSPRNAELLDINGMDPETGDTVLHEFVKKRDVIMCRWLLEHGADPFKRDRKGKLPIELVRKVNENDTATNTKIAIDIELKKLLERATREQSVIDVTNNNLHEAPTYKGYLKKWTNFAQGYKLRWFILSSDGKLSYYIDQADTKNACRGSLNMSSCSLHLDSSEKLKFEIIGGNNGVIRWHLKGNHPIETNRWVWAIQGAIRYAKDREILLHNGPYSPSLALSHGLSSKVKSTVSSTRAADIPSDDEGYSEDDSDDDGNSSYTMENGGENDGDEDLNAIYGPYIQKLHMLQRSISIELASLNELLQDKQQHDEYWNTVNTSIETVSEFFDKLNRLTSQREKRMIAQMTKQRDVNNVWIQSVKDLEMELVDKDEKLVALDKERKNLKKMLQKKLNNQPQVETEANEESDDANSMIKGSQESTNTLEEIVKFIEATKESDEDSDADEFFDAEEAASDKKTNDSENLTTSKETPANAKPQEEAPEDESLIVISSPQVEKKNQLLKEGSFVGYEDPVRTKLALDEDNRPKIGLWSVLKSMVGQDLTKLTLPVSFNEPTSLLQRVSEDIEYSHILDQAATFEDSSLRMLYVAAFTASMYASTTNRVSKPFNPLLGETFEYARTDGQYRFFTEQVSHHPPISATWTESPKWDFYGECNVDSSFNGRTFAVQHLGLWYITIRPDHNISVPEETYSWKKPNNTVIGILMGKPQVDNSGDVKVTNHTTGDYCMLHYKAHGWTSAGAYEVRGEVFNKDDKKLWVLGGHWNDSIYGKKVTARGGELTLDRIKTANSATGGPKLDGSKFLIWKANERPSVPFNLTSFALTLNALPPHLVPYLAPTDSRLRPDQRAMENGEYDKAAAEKHRVEVKQRAAKKEREQKGEEYRPKWFVQEEHPVTKSLYWKFNGEYWNKRKNHDFKDCADIF
ncbi:BAF_collapsed_G0000810.mRNA.1.CDS.1 [Saccharomyces cerevisiae]|nr:CFA_G0000760.mRNA.1.CDS.1 [Saccharomyces cerevisiae]CAI5229511.1 BAF_HP2_G0000800.mRNA.1.CDS.1 [Saccharomyces cerevisiae]CAI6385162.1 BAF_HP2_G0000800.mRNA.1.CDS.1 [Saccharomyces cerevisiae]CAI6468215.1 BAF_HP1_G0000790.mRNA.1.CDS.1 [Saccharomyces cerevisiae]CAI7035841.1 BAF_collapsed_G0000810.mRNA.1.CDS.1 [Saccharomyces cerevisiae]